jgi:hypothetical protein
LAAGFFVCAGVVGGFAFVAVLPVRVVAGASDGSVAPLMPTHANQPPSSGRTFVKP